MSEIASTDRIEPYVWRIAGVVILGMIMSILDTTIVNVALDTLGRDLHSSLSQIQWVITGYLLSLAAVIPVTGWAARRFGAKRVYLVSLVLFTIGSTLCGLASSATSLVAFRVLQGIGGGMIMPVAQMIMAQVAGPRRMGRVMGVVVMPAMLAPILGPVIGGIILESLHWSWIFYVNVPIGIVAVILGLRMLPDVDLGKAGRLDTLGLVLLATSMPLFVYGLSEIGTRSSFTAPTVVWPIAVSLVLTTIFVWHALRVERPLLDIRLYANRVFGAASITTFGLGAALFGAMILVPLYYQQVRGESVIVTGLLVGPQGLGMLAMAPFNGRLTQRYGGGRVAIVGVSILCLSTLPLCFVGANTSILAISLVLAVRGLGIGLSFMPTMTAAFASLRSDELSDATPQMNVLQRVGGAIGTAVLAVVLQRAGAHAHSSAELASAFDTAYWWSLGIAALSLIPCVVLVRAENPRAKLTRAEAAAESAVEPLGA
ncbi:MAG TPA: MDR family MFS transporter [Solirubrobacteraceae bacterium]|jgi:EmrB/QacA subfamily drug resistance transporter|nr:MDR family MFS transporter [Solirubrobacteraceae bacterium]